MNKKVLVSGCFDVLHSGHIRFFEEAAAYGDVYVSIGSDANVEKLKNRTPLYNEDERKYMVESLKYVAKAFIGPGIGLMDFEPLLDVIEPDIFFVNTDGDSAAKRALIEQRGIKYVVSTRAPKEKLPSRSTTAIRNVIKK